jgi:hypothetical protein
MIKKILLFSVVFFSFSGVILADPPGPPDPGGNPVGTGGVPVGAPIDNGIYGLLILGVGYAVWTLYTAKKKQKTDLVN